MDETVKKKKLPVYRLVVSEDNDSTQVDVVSMVTNPAIEKTWTAFGEESEFKRFKFTCQDSIKHNVAGPFMVPDFPIYRKADKTQNTEECYVVFQKEDIENAIKKFSKNNYNTNITSNHDNKNVGAYVMESWIVTDPKKDKSLIYGAEMPAGTWYGIIHIEDQKYWDEFIMTGELTGYSVEGKFEIGDKITEKEMAFGKNIDSESPISLDKLADFVIEMMKTK